MQKQANLSKILKQLDTYEPLSLLGSGSYGEVYKGISKDPLDNQYKNEVAMKIEKSRFSQFQKEYKITKDLLENSSSEQARIPNIFQTTTIDGYQILIYELLGPNLEDLFALCNQRFSLKTIITLAMQSVQRLEYMHSRGYLHRDIKPSNFLMGGNHQNAKFLYIIDFGLSTSYLKINSNNTSYEHVKQQRNRSLVGSLRYASVNSMNGLSQGRKDDLESLAYMFAYFLNQGTLPWKDMFAASKEQLVELICKKKQVFEFGTNVPECFQKYLDYVKSLKFAEEPNYQYLISLFKNQLKQMNEQINYEYDWSHLIQNNIKAQDQSSSQINNIYEWLHNENQETKLDSAKLQSSSGSSCSNGGLSSNSDNDIQIQNNNQSQQQIQIQQESKKQKVLIGSNQMPSKKSNHHNLLTCFGF